MEIEDLTQEQRKELDDWFFENPHCTHAAWLSMIAKIKNKYVEKEDDGFFDALANKVLCHDKGLSKTFYLFAEKTNNHYIASTFYFEIVRNTLASYHAGCVEVTENNCECFKQMRQSSRQEIKELVEKSIHSLISKFDE